MRISDHLEHLGFDCQRRPAWAGPSAGGIISIFIAGKNRLETMAAAMGCSPDAKFSWIQPTPQPPRRQTRGIDLNAEAQRRKEINMKELRVSAVNPGLALDRIYKIHRISFILTVLFILSKAQAAKEIYPALRDAGSGGRSERVPADPFTESTG